MTVKANLSHNQEPPIILNPQSTQTKNICTSAHPMTGSDTLSPPQSQAPGPKPVAPRLFFDMWEDIYRFDQNKPDSSETLTQRINDACNGINPASGEWKYLIEHPNQFTQIIWTAKNIFCWGKEQEAATDWKTKETALAPFQALVPEIVQKIIVERRSKATEHHPETISLPGSGASKFSYLTGSDNPRSPASSSRPYTSLTQDHMGPPRPLSVNGAFSNTPVRTLADTMSTGPKPPNCKTLLACLL